MHIEWLQAQRDNDHLEAGELKCISKPIMVTVIGVLLFAGYRAMPENTGSCVLLSILQGRSYYYPYYIYYPKKALEIWSRFL